MVARVELGHGRPWRPSPQVAPPPRPRARAAAASWRAANPAAGGEGKKMSNISKKCYNILQNVDKKVDKIN
jgi:hypothetical protein